MSPGKDVEMLGSDVGEVRSAGEEGVMENCVADERELSKVEEYCRRVLRESSGLSGAGDIVDQSGVSKFRLQVNKMKKWPSFDHIFKAARRDNKWYLRSQPLSGINKILFEEQKLVNISKAVYKGLIVTPIPEEVIETAVQTIVNSNEVLPKLSDYTVKKKEPKQLKTSSG